MIDIVTDPMPSDEAMRRLWLAAWGSEGPASFEAILTRSLVHVGAYDEALLIGFVNVAWDGAFTPSSSIPVSTRITVGRAWRYGWSRVRWKWRGTAARSGCMSISSRIWRGFTANAGLGRRRQD